jgi:hypothetical protein
LAGKETTIKSIQILIFYQKYMNKMNCRPVSIYISPRFTGGFCDTDETIEFEIRIYPVKEGVFRGDIYYHDNFTLELPKPILPEGDGTQKVSKTLLVYEEFFSRSPRLLEGKSHEEVINSVIERLNHHSFRMAD